MITMWKCQLETAPIAVRTSMPGPGWVTCGLDPQGLPCVWVRVDTDQPLTVVRRFAVFGTGHQFPGDTARLVGTILSAPFVWHVVELL